VCALEDIDILITDSAVADRHVKALEKACVTVIVAKD
jgi:DeoR/GlpR family transcriptional regulator of sugar metabolism